MPHIATLERHDASQIIAGLADMSRVTNDGMVTCAWTQTELRNIRLGFRGARFVIDNEVLLDRWDTAEADRGRQNACIDRYRAELGSLSTEPVFPEEIFGSLED